MLIFGLFVSCYLGVFDFVVFFFNLVMNFESGMVYVELDVDDEYECSMGDMFLVFDLEVLFIDFELFILVEYIFIIYGYCLSVDCLLEIIIIEWIVEECVDFIGIIGL